MVSNEASILFIRNYQSLLRKIKRLKTLNISKSVQTNTSKIVLVLASSVGAGLSKRGAVTESYKGQIRLEGPSLCLFQIRSAAVLAGLQLSVHRG